MYISHVRANVYLDTGYLSVCSTIPQYNMLLLWGHWQTFVGCMGRLRGFF